MSAPSVQFIDCTLREGDQSPGVWLDSADKLALFALLDAAGVAVVDAGMPAISPQERELLAALAAIPDRGTRVGASVRCSVEEVALAADCGVDEVFLIFPVSTVHRRERLGLGPSSWRSRGSAALAACEEHGLVADLVLEDASRAEPEALADAIELAVRGGAARVMVCDTVGVLTPTKAGELIRSVLDLCRGRLEVGSHFHDDYGMATANTLAAIEVGATWPSVTVNGVGERAGNAVLAEVALATLNLLDLDCAITPERMVELSAEVERRTGQFLAPDAPLVGTQAFAHESGIHVDGILKSPRTYEAIDPQQLRRRRRITFGKHTGRAGLGDFARRSRLPTEGPVFEAVLRRLKQRRPPEYGEDIDGFLAARDRFLSEQRGVPAAILERWFEELSR